MLCGNLSKIFVISKVVSVGNRTLERAAMRVDKGHSPGGNAFARRGCQMASGMTGSRRASSMSRTVQVA